LAAVPPLQQWSTSEKAILFEHSTALFSVSYHHYSHKQLHSIDRMAYIMTGRLICILLKIILDPILLSCILHHSYFTQPG